jgi:hypothetical protein
MTGAKPLLRPKHVWSIHIKLQMAGRKRDLAAVQSCHRRQAVASTSTITAFSMSMR